MPRLILPAVLFLALVTSLRAQTTNEPTASTPPPGTPPPPPTDPLVEKIQAELGNADLPAEYKVDPAIPHGELIRDGKITDSAIYPGTENDFTVYVPAQYDPAKPACLLVKLDGFGGNEATVLDHLIASKEIPVMIAIGVVPGTVWKDPVAPTVPPGSPPGTKPKQRAATRYNRCYEFDSTNDHFPDYVLNELLPAVQKMTTKDGRPIHISPDGNDHASTGGSSGGIGAFTLAWRRPDQFSRVYDVIGTFVSMRGGHEYPALIRKTEPKPFRIFLEDGSYDAWNPLFGVWFDANLNMNSALTFAGYDVAHAWGVHGHNGKPGAGIFPDVMRWLWRDYPAPIKEGVSQNSSLKETLVPDEYWHKIPQTFQSAAGLAANAKGDVYISDETASTVYQLGADDKSTAFATGSAIEGEAFGPDGTLYGLVPSEKKIVAVDAQGSSHPVTDGIVGRNILATSNGVLYVSEPGEHTDMPSHLWQIKTDGTKTKMDDGLSAASGIAFSPDASLFLAAEHTTKWIYSYVVQPDGSFADKQMFYWLHMTDIPNDSGAEDIALDVNGNVYAATRMGVQIADQNGRVRAILPLPTPCGPVRSLCFGGEKFDTLYVTDGKQVFKRKLLIPGYPQWEKPIKARPQGMG